VLKVVIRSRHTRIVNFSRSTDCYLSVRVRFKVISVKTAQKRSFKGFMASKKLENRLMVGETPSIQIKILQNRNYDSAL
jgi:hypothetical protein